MGFSQSTRTRLEMEEPGNRQRHSPSQTSNQTSTDTTAAFTEQGTSELATLNQPPHQALI